MLWHAVLMLPHAVLMVRHVLGMFIVLSTHTLREARLG
jgi:hypothetical protein